MDIFAQAARTKLRFETAKGSVSVEDLWDLPLTSAVKDKPNLDDIGITLKRKIDEHPQMSLVNPGKKNPQEERDQLAFAIVQAIINTKLEEATALSNKNALKQEEQRIMEALAKKSDAAIDNMSEADLQKRLNELRARTA